MFWIKKKSDFLPIFSAVCCETGAVVKAHKPGIWFLTVP